MGTKTAMKEQTAKGFGSSWSEGVQLHYPICIPSLTCQYESRTLPSPLVPQGLAGSVISTIMTVTLSRLLMGSMAWSASELATEQRRSTISS